MSRRPIVGREHIVVVGAMGSGKTSVGQGLARQLGREFIDSDQQIRERTGREGSAIAAEEGVDALHAMEREVLWDALGSDRPVVIAAAASVIEDDEVRQVLGGLHCIWLRADPESLEERQARSGHRRRVGDGEAVRMERRIPLYESCADFAIDTTSVTAEEAVASVMEMLGARDG
jgi:shikimate kinase